MSLEKINYCKLGYLTGPGKTGQRYVLSNIFGHKEFQEVQVVLNPNALNCFIKVKRFCMESLESIKVQK